MNILKKRISFLIIAALSSIVANDIKSAESASSSSSSDEEIVYINPRGKVKQISRLQQARKHAQRGVRKIGQVLMGLLPVDALYEEEEEEKEIGEPAYHQEVFNFTGLLPELQDQIIGFILVSNNAKTLDAAAWAIRSLALVSPKLYDLVHNSDTTFLIADRLSRRFGKPKIEVARALHNKNLENYFVDQMFGGIPFTWYQS